MKHTVKSGETLSYIAKLYGFASIDPIYNHADNSDFKKVRPNPDVIYEGDVLFIPKTTPAKLSLKINKKNTLTLKQPKEKLTLLLQFEEDKDNQGANIDTILLVDDVEYPSKSNGDGLVEWDVPKTRTRTGLVKLFMEKNQSEATHVFEVLLGDLNPVSEAIGIQARLSNLGFHCGRLDGKLREKTEKAIKSFQKAKNLTVDGDAGQNTIKALEDHYGC